MTPNVPAQAAKYRNSFPALLKSENGKLLEIGQGAVSLENASVDFFSDFVPLFTMGTPVQVVRTFHKKELQRFSGTVYLSSEKYLRITSVTDELLEGSEKYYLFPAELPARVFYTPVDEKSGFFKRRREAALTWMPMTVTMIGMDSLTLTCEEELPEEDSYLLSMESPIRLERVSVPLERQLHFGGDIVTYTCDLTALPANAKAPWDTFITQLHQKTNKLF